MITNKLVNDKDLKNKSYREAVGSLLYLSIISRPDISYAVNYLSRQICKLKVSHWKMIERVFRYLRGTENLGIFFDGKYKLRVYTDSNYGGDDENRCSTYGVLMENGGPIVLCTEAESHSYFISRRISCSSPGYIRNKLDSSSS